MLVLLVYLASAMSGCESRIDLSFLQAGERVVLQQAKELSELYEKPIAINSGIKGISISEAYDVGQQQYQLVATSRHLSYLQQAKEYNPFSSKPSQRRLQQNVAKDFFDEFKVFESVILQDDREVVNSTDVFPFSSIVHIDFTCPSEPDKRFRCSGTMISANTVLTSAHCIKRYDRNILSGEYCYDYIISPGKQGPFEPFGNSKVIRTEITVEWEDTLTNFTYSDYGLMVIQDNLGELTGWMAIALDCFQTNYDELMVAGYPKDLTYDGDTMVSSKCSVELNACQNNVSDGMFQHTCDTTGGESGSAMWILNKDNRREIRGIHAQGVSSRSQGQNLGVYISVEAYVWISLNQDL